MKINATIKKELAQSLCELSNQLVKNNILYVYLFSIRTSFSCKRRYGYTGSGNL